MNTRFTKRVIGGLIVIIIIFFKVLGLVKTEDVVIGLFDENWRIERQKTCITRREFNTRFFWSSLLFTPKYYLPWPLRSLSWKTFSTWVLKSC